MNNNGKWSEWSERCAAPTTGGAGAMPQQEIQSLTRSFSMYITHVYYAIIEPRLHEKYVTRYVLVSGGNREGRAALPGAAHCSYNPDGEQWRSENIYAYLTASHVNWYVSYKEITTSAGKYSANHCISVVSEIVGCMDRQRPKHKPCQYTLGLQRHIQGGP